MPPLGKPREPRRVVLPPRTATLAPHCDVLVVGGGPAGLGAALGAAGLGCRVVLAERYGFLGGNATAALVGGRCISGTHEAPSSYRVMPTAMATGQAAAVGAALAARSGLTPREPPAGEVQDRLRRQGAVLHTDPSRGRSEAAISLARGGAPR